MVSAGIGIRSLEFRVLGPSPAAGAAARQLHTLISALQPLPSETPCPPPAGFVGATWSLKAPPFSHPSNQIVTWMDELRQSYQEVVFITTSASDDIHTCEVWFPRACPLGPCASVDRMCSTDEGMLTLDVTVQALTVFVEPVVVRSLDEWFVRFASDAIIASRLSGLQAWLRSHHMNALLPQPCAMTSEKGRL